MSELSKSVSPDQPEITLSRMFDAPRELVLRASTDPEHLKQWWGPAGFTSPHCEVDLRVGGQWRLDMQGPDGTIYPNRGEYLAVDPPSRLVLSDIVEDTDAWSDNPPPSAVHTMTFEDVDGKIRFTLTTRLESIAARDAILEMGVAEGWTESFEKLERLLAAG